MSEWQPIESAPSLSDAFLVCGRHRDGSPWWNIGHAVCGEVIGDWDDDLKPTHWQPLPVPPSQEQPA